MNNGDTSREIINHQNVSGRHDNTLINLPNGFDQSTYLPIYSTNAQESENITRKISITVHKTNRAFAFCQIGARPPSNKQ